MVWCRMMIITWLLITYSGLVFGQDTANTISRDHFNFGHQVGYMYSRVGDARFRDRGVWHFETGAATLYTKKMPLVQNDHWKTYTFMYIPLYFEVSPSDNIILQIEVTDFFIELPYYDIHSMGGKSPRFKTKVRLCGEKGYRPAVAFTVGVKFSSAKPWVIWRHDHNYDESNGLCGAGTGVADYLLLFTFSKNISTMTTLHSHVGLIPVGSPVSYTRGSAQADEIPYGIRVQHRFSSRISGVVEWSGMYNGLSSTKLAHYSIIRFKGEFHSGRQGYRVTLQHGLTEESDEWGGGVFGVFEFGKK